MTQPRYAAYCAAHGRDPESMLLYDRARFPGGVMVGFMVWLHEHWERWMPEYRYRSKTSEDHEAFTAWLLDQYPAARKYCE